MRQDTVHGSFHRRRARIAPGARSPTFRNFRRRRGAMADSTRQHEPAQARQLRLAARALARAGLVHAYGHCSLRIDSDHFIVSPAKPLGLVTPEDAVVVVPTHGALPPEALPEVLAHQYIYRQRRDVSGIVRFPSPNLTALSTLGLTPKARHGFGAYFAPCA